jgi:hypothetical protein
LSSQFDPSADPSTAGASGEDELMREQRAAYEAELSRITVPDMLMQATVTLLNLAAARLAPAPAGGGADPAPGGGAGGRDLEQARDAIDAVRALLEVLERRMAGELGPLRDALSRLQLAYAAEAGRAGGEAQGAATPGAGGDATPTSGAPGSSGPGGPDAAGSGEAPEPDGREGGPAGDDDQQRPPGPAESSGRLWVPGR